MHYLIEAHVTVCIIDDGEEITTLLSDNNIVEILLSF